MRRKTCLVTDCGRPIAYVAKRLCNRHYLRWLRHGDPLAGKFERHHGVPLVDRFWLNVDKNGPKQPHMKTRCWVWIGKSRANHGYGLIRTDDRKRLLRSHRVSWNIHSGEIPADKRVLHKCDRTDCIRPSHLYLGSQKENVHDMFDRGRANPRGLWKGRAV